MAAKPPLVFPTLHLNGTSRDALAQQLEEAVTAGQTFVRACDAAAPNARDYYPQGPAAFKQAASEHAARCARARDVAEELNRILEYVLDAG